MKWKKHHREDADEYGEEDEEGNGDGRLNGHGHDD